MDLKIISDNENQLLNRREVAFEVNHTNASTPSRAEIRSKLAAMLTVKKDLLVVNSFSAKFGTQISSGTANIYSDVKVMERIEPKAMIERNKKAEPKKEEPKEEAPAEATAEEKAEAPAEEEKGEE